MINAKNRFPSHNLDRNHLLSVARSFYPKKHLGQNFLIEPAQLLFIANALKLSADDVVLEIGPGLGFLTGYLSASGARIKAVELDAQCVSYLQSLELNGVSIAHGDFLQFDLSCLGDTPLKVVGNVPYQITSAILAHLFGEIGHPAPWIDKISTLVMTVQKELV